MCITSMSGMIWKRFEYCNTQVMILAWRTGSRSLGVLLWSDLSVRAGDNQVLISVTRIPEAFSSRNSRNSAVYYTFHISVFSYNSLAVDLLHNIRQQRSPSLSPFRFRVILPLSYLVSIMSDFSSK